MKDQDQTERDRQARDIFLRAVEIHLPEAKAAYVEGACQHDASLRSRVEALLGNHRKDSFLETAAISGAPTAISRTTISEGPGTVIGRYTLLQMIGDGGFGVVYMAEQKEPVRRRVALKIIKLGMDTQQVVARFEAERQALAMMDHPNIAKVLDGGATETPLPPARPEPLRRGEGPARGHPLPSSDEGRGQGEGSHSQPSTLHPQLPSGRPYFVMELVKGQIITKYCDEHKLSTRQRLELFIPICQAIQHAHQKGIIHRDIKPSNILIATIDGRPVPKVIDFGIAKATQHDLTDKIVFTQFHQFMGTPAYMSPEQAAMDSTDIDTRSDICSLGVLLYELLTGKTPVEAKELTRGGYDEIRRRIREIEPPTPSNRLSTLTNDELTTVARSRAIEPARLAKLIRGELDWVVLKAMDKDRSRRYETASALALDIQRYLDNEPVTAVKPSPIYHLQKFARRHKVALATAAEEARLKEMNAKQRETELRRIAETERDRSQRLLYTANMNLAKRAWDEANVNYVEKLLDLHRPQPDQPDLRNFEWFYLDRISHSELFTIRKDTNAVDWRTLTFSPDGKRLAAASAQGAVKIWGATSGQELLTLELHSNRVSAFSHIAFSPDGKWIASAATPAVKLWDVASGKEILAFTGGNSSVFGVAFSPDGTRLASVNWEYVRRAKVIKMKVWDTRSGQEVLKMEGPTNLFKMVAFSQDGKRMAAAASHQVRIWDALSGQELLTLNFPGKGLGGLSSAALSADGKRLATGMAEGSSDPPGTLKILDATTGENPMATKLRWIGRSGGFLE